MKQGFGDGQRHGWLSQMCALLERVAVGRAAAELRDQIKAERAYDRSALVVLPMWTWVRAGSTAGRKGQAADGGKLLLPARVTWTDGHLLHLVPTGSTVTTTWAAVGNGRSARGTSVLEASALRRHTPGASSGMASAAALPATHYSAMALSRSALLRELDALVADGRLAWWEAISVLEPYLRKAVDHAHTAVAAELSSRSGSLRHQILSETSLDSITDLMLLGVEGTPASVERLLNACLRQSFTKVDPMRYIRIWLRRDAHEAIRRSIDDPKQGPKVRSLFDASEVEGPGDLLEVYQERYPADQVGLGRIERALNVCTDPMAERSSLDSIYFTTEHEGQDRASDRRRPLEDSETAA
jgi:hypothetical protein